MIKDSRLSEHLEIFNNKPFNLIKCYYHDTSEQGPINIHKHGFHELDIVTGGNAMHYMANEGTVAKVGSVFMISPNVEHGYLYDTNLVVFRMMIHTGFITRYSKELYSVYGNLLHDLNINLDKSNLNRIKHVLDELDSLKNADSNISDIMKNSLAMYLLSKLSTFKTSETDSKDKVYRDEVERCVKYINLNYKKKIKTKELCEMVDLSYTSLRNLFIEAYGMTPSEYLQDLRIGNALDLLRNTEKPVLDIALECGFYDGAHFNKIFKKKTGYSPHAYRSTRT